MLKILQYCVTVEGAQFIPINAISQICFTCSQHHVSLNVHCRFHCNIQIKPEMFTQVCRCQNKHLPGPFNSIFFSVSTCGIFLLDLSACAQSILLRSYQIVFLSPLSSMLRSNHYHFLMFTICMQCKAFHKLHNQTGQTAWSQQWQRAALRGYIG